MLVSPKQIASYAKGCKTRGETDMQHAVLGLLTSMRISDVVKRGGDISVITHIYEKGGHGKRGRTDRVKK